MAQKKKMATKDFLGFENVVDFNEKLKAYFEENARQIIAIGLIICLSAGAVAYWTISSKASAQAAQNMLNQALTAMSAAPTTEAERTAALTSAIDMLSRAIETYKRTEAGRAALFYRARCKSRIQDYSGAITDYTAFLQFSGPMAEQLRGFALENLGYAHEALGNTAEALQWFEKAVQAGRRTALVAMARMHENAGSRVQACECYQKYLADQSDTGYREFVEMKIGDVCRTE
jgi:predicted negative regulator of RcsB-dependent stress response